MALATLDADISGPDLIRENIHPLVHLEAHPLTKTLASVFALLQDDLLVSLSD